METRVAETPPPVPKPIVATLEERVNALEVKCGNQNGSPPTPAGGKTEPTTPPKSEMTRHHLTQLLVIVVGIILATLIAFFPRTDSDLVRQEKKVVPHQTESATKMPGMEKHVVAFSLTEIFEGPKPISLTTSEGSSQLRIPSGYRVDITPNH